jgi:hypothetical protein
MFRHPAPLCQNCSESMALVTRFSLWGNYENTADHICGDHFRIEVCNSVLYFKPLTSVLTRDHWKHLELPNVRPKDLRQLCE